MSPNRKEQPMIMDVIEKSGLTSFDFFQNFMVEDYLNMFEKLSFVSGVNFEPHSQNLVMETTADLKPTGKWVLRDFGGVWPDVIAMAKNGGPVDVYMEAASAVKYKLRGGRSNYISSYVFFYKRQVFDMMLTEVAKYDPAMTPEKMQLLQNNIDSRFTKMINTHLGLKLKEVPTMATYKKIEEMVIAQTELNDKTIRKSVVDNNAVKAFIENKKTQKEWIDFAPKKGKSEFVLTDHGLYEISDKKIIGLALFNRQELDHYKIHQTLPTLDLSPVMKKVPELGCIGAVMAFFQR